MQVLLIIWTFLLAVLWIPLAAKFLHSWRTRRNPVSLAICATTLLFTYANCMYILALLGETTWRFYAIATRGFEFVVAVNFFIAFRWSDTKFAGNRRTDSIPPQTKSTSEPPAA